MRWSNQFAPEPETNNVRQTGAYPRFPLVGYHGMGRKRTDIAVADETPDFQLLDPYRGRRLGPRHTPDPAYADPPRFAAAMASLGLV
jgi:hypothetical protein